MTLIGLHKTQRLVNCVVMPSDGLKLHWDDNTRNHSTWLVDEFHLHNQCQLQRHHTVSRLMMFNTQTHRQTDTHRQTSFPYMTSSASAA